MTTKNAILSALQRESLTVVQLCERLGVTRNAINVQLKQLEAEGRVRRRKSLQTGAPGKPAIAYESAPGSEDLTSSAYRDFLLSLVAVLRDSLPSAQLGDLLEETGRRLAREGGLAASGNFEQDLARAMSAADAMGATTEATPVPGGIMVRNYSCPVGGAVRKDACACRALAAVFSEATGQTVVEQCLRGDKLICQYFIKWTPPSKPSPTKRSRI